MPSREEQDATFNKLKAILERPERPANETDDSILETLRQCDTLRNDQLLALATLATGKYNEALHRNILALQLEGLRLQAQIQRLGTECHHSTQRMGAYALLPREQQKDVLMRDALQRVRLDEDTAGLRQRAG